MSSKPTIAGFTYTPSAAPTRDPTSLPSSLAPLLPGFTYAPSTIYPTGSPSTNIPTVSGYTYTPTTATPSTEAPSASPSFQPSTALPSVEPSTATPTLAGFTYAPSSAAPTTVAPTPQPLGCAFSAFGINGPWVTQPSFTTCSACQVTSFLLQFFSTLFFILFFFFVIIIIIIKIITIYISIYILFNSSRVHPMSCAITTNLALLWGRLLTLRCVPCPLPMLPPLANQPKQSPLCFPLIFPLWSPVRAHLLPKHPQPFPLLPLTHPLGSLQLQSLLHQLNHLLSFLLISPPIFLRLLRPPLRLKNLRPCHPKLPLFPLLFPR